MNEYSRIVNAQMERVFMFSERLRRSDPDNPELMHVGNSVDGFYVSTDFMDCYGYEGGFAAALKRYAQRLEEILKPVFP
jgi:hypothetical protein